MKKTIVIFLGIIVGVYVFFSLIDRSDYPLEKKLWRVQKQLDQVTRVPAVVPDQKFDSVAQEYRNLIKKYPKSALTPKMYLPIGRMYVLKKDYNKARETFSEVIKAYPQNQGVAAEALLNIGHSYELENNERDAVRTYKVIMEKYPLTEVGINIPLYISNYYLKQNKQAEADQSMQEAATHYRKIAQDNPKTKSEFTALRLLVTTYTAQKKWEAAVNSLERLLMEFATSEYMSPQEADFTLKTINTISAAHLKSYDIPINIYQKFINRYPKHPLNKRLNEMISGLKTLKEKGVGLSTEKSG